MLGWIALLKTTLPYVTQIVTSAIPAFTSKPEVSKVDPVVSKQIEELQAAVTKNAESINVIAEKLQQTILGIESAANSFQKQASMFKTMLFVSLAISIIALAVAAWAIAH